MKILLYLLFATNLIWAQVVSEGLQQRIFNYETQTQEAIKKSLESITGTSNHVVFVQIDVNESQLSQSLINKAGPTSLKILDNLPGLYIDPEEIDFSPQIKEFTRTQIAKAITGVKVDINTDNQDIASSQTVNDIIKKVVAFQLPGANAVNIQYSSLSSDPSSDSSLGGGKFFGKQRGTSISDTFLTQHLPNFAGLIIVLASLFWILRSYGSKIIDVFQGIESAIKDINFSIPSPVMPSAANNTSEQKSSSETSFSETTTQLLKVIEEFASKDFEGYQKAFQAYYEMGQVDEAVLMATLSGKLADSAQELLSEIEAQRFKKRFQEISVNIYESKESLKRVCDSVIGSFRIAKSSRETFANYVLRKKVANTAVLEAQDFTQFSPEEIALLLQMSPSDFIADKLYKNEISLNQLNNEHVELTVEQKLSLIKRLSTQDVQVEHEQEHKNKLIEVAMSLPMDLEENFIRDMGLTQNDYPIKLTDQDKEKLALFIKGLDLNQTSDFLSCLTDETRIDLINALPEVLAQRIFSKGFTVTEAGRQLKKQAWKTIMSERKEQNNEVDKNDPLAA